MLKALLLAFISFVTAQTPGYDWNGFSASGLGCGSDSGALNVGLGQSLPPGATGLKVKQISFAIYGTNSLPPFIQLHGSTATPRLSTSAAVQCCGSGCDLAVQVAAEGYSWYNSPCGRPSCTNANKWYYMDFSGTAVGTTEQTGISEATFWNAGGSQIGANMINLGSGSVFFMSYTVIIPSPTPTPSLTKSPVSPSLTASETASTSVSRSVTASRSIDPTDSRSVSASRSVSSSESTDRTSSRSESVSRSMSRSPSAEATDSRTTSRSMSASRAPSVTPSSSRAASLTQSQSMSGSPVSSSPTPTVSPYMPWFQGLTGCCHNSLDTSVQALNVLTPYPYVNMGINRISIQYWPLAAGTATFTIALMDVAGGSMPGGTILGSKMFSVTSPGSFPTYPQQVATFTDLEPISSYVLGGDVEYALAFYNATPGIIDLVLGVPSLSPFFWNGLMTESTGSFYTVGETDPTTAFWYQSTNIAFVAVGAGSVTSSSPSRSSSSSVSATESSSPSITLAASQSTTVSATESSSPSITLAASQSTTVSPTESSSYTTTLTLSRSSSSSSSLSVTTAASATESSSFSVAATLSRSPSSSLTSTSTSSISETDSSSRSNTVSRSSSSSVTSAVSWSTTSSLTPAVSQSSSSSPSITSSLTLTVSQSSSPSFSSSATPSVSQSSSPSFSSSVTPAVSQSPSFSATPAVSHSSSPSSSSSSSATPAVSQSSSPSSSPSFSMTPAVSQSSSPSSSVTPTVSQSSSVTMSTSRSSDTSGSPTFSVSVSMSVTISSSGSLSASSSSSSSSPQSFQQVNNISTVMSATSTPQFMFTAYPTTSSTYSPTQNYTLPIIVVDGQATNMTTTNALIGSTLALIIVAVALAAGRYLPSGLVQRCRRMIPDNFKRDPLGSVTAMVNDPKNVLKNINIQIPDSVKSLSNMVPQSIKDKIVPKELQELVGITPSEPEPSQKSEVIATNTTPPAPASSRKIQIPPPSVRREITPEPIQEEEEEEKKEQTVQVAGLTGVTEDGGIVTAKPKEEVTSTILKIDAADLEAVQSLLNLRNSAHVVLH